MSLLSKRSLLKEISALLMIVVLSFTTASFISQEHVYANQQASDSDITDSNSNDGGCSSTFLGFPTWYRGLVDKTDEGCAITPPPAGTDGLSNYIWHIVLNVIEIAMMLVGYLTVIFIIYGGILYITSAGDSKGVEKAKASITNAVIGLVISIVAVAIVEFIFSRLGAA